MSVRIFEAPSMQEALDDLLDEGFFPADPDIVRGLVAEEKIPWRWYGTGLLRQRDGSTRHASVAELRDVARVYDCGERLLSLSGNGELGRYSFSDGGRFVGVDQEARG